jgi:hypothetical protein
MLMALIIGVFFQRLLYGCVCEDDVVERFGEVLLVEFHRVVLSI